MTYRITIDLDVSNEAVRELLEAHGWPYDPANTGAGSGVLLSEVCAWAESIGARPGQGNVKAVRIEQS